MTFGRGNAFPDDIVTGFVVSKTFPARAETKCDGVLTHDDVPVAPTDAQGFANELEALVSAEHEIEYEPQQYGWDGSSDGGIGWTLGGTTTQQAREKATTFTLSKCAFSRGFILNGNGSYAADTDRWMFDIAVSGDSLRKLS